jgi:hypothetical protein
MLDLTGDSGCDLVLLEKAARQLSQMRRDAEAIGHLELSHDSLTDAYVREQSRWAVRHSTRVAACRVMCRDKYIAERICGS